MPLCPYCSLCGIMMENPALYGTDAHGEVDNRYCIYCYSRGVLHPVEDNKVAEDI